MQLNAIPRKVFSGSDLSYAECRCMRSNSSIACSLSGIRQLGYFLCDVAKHVVG